MKARTRMGLLIGILAVAGIILVGCKKEEPAPAPQPMTQSHEEPNDAMAPGMSAMTETATSTADEMAQKAAEQAQTAVEQTVCPVMDGNPIDKNIFVEYQGKKVYFCCKDCVERFKADPEKYIAKLPQFSGK